MFARKQIGIEGRRGGKMNRHVCQNVFGFLYSRGRGDGGHPEKGEDSSELASRARWCHELSPPSFVQEMVRVLTLHRRDLHAVARQSPELLDSAVEKTFCMLEVRGSVCVAIISYHNNTNPIFRLGSAPEGGTPT